MSKLLQKIANKHELDISAYNPEQLIKGMKAEKEHDDGSDIDVAKNVGDLMKIAMAHLNELPDYYDRLEKMENEDIVRREIQKEIKSLNEDISSKTLKELDKQLKNHDWYYGFSDDRRYYDAGKMQKQEIEDTLKKLHSMGAGTQAKKLWNKYTKDMKYVYYPIKGK